MSLKNYLVVRDKYLLYVSCLKNQLILVNVKQSQNCNLYIFISYLLIQLFCDTSLELITNNNVYIFKRFFKKNIKILAVLRTINLTTVKTQALCTIYYKLYNLIKLSFIQALDYLDQFILELTHFNI